MSRIIELTLSDQLLADVEPVLAQGQSTLDNYILEAVIWYTLYQRQRQMAVETVDWTDTNLNDADDQTKLLIQIHEELAPYTADVLQTALDETEEDWEALLA